MQDLELRKERVQNFLKIAAVPVLGFIVAPFIVSTITGLAGLIVALVISFTAIKFMPVISLKISNAALKAYKSEVTENPIEALDREIQTRMKALEEAEKHINMIAGELKVFHSEVQRVKKEYPENVEPYMEQYRLGNQFLEEQKGVYNEAFDDLEKFKREVKEAGTMWRLGKSAEKLQGLKALNGQEFMAQLTVNTAFASVQRKMATSFASLELAQKKGNKFTLGSTPKHMQPPPLPPATA